MKKFLSFIITFIMIVMLSSNKFTIKAAQNIINDNVQVAISDTDMSDVKPVVILENTDIPQAVRGNTLNLNLNFKNVSSHIARNFLVSLDFGGELPFDIKNLTLERTAEKIYPDKVVPIDYKFKIKGDAEAKTYPITVNYSYTNSVGVPYSKSQTVYIRVTEGIPEEKVVISNLETKYSVVNSKDNFDINFTIRNEGERQMNDVKVSLEGIEDEGLEIKDKKFTQSLGTLRAYNDEKDVTFNVGEVSDPNISFKPDDSEDEEKNYKVVIKVDYINSDGEDKVFRKTIYLKNDSAGSSNLSIQNVVAPPNSVNPNEPFEIKFSLRNDGDGAAKNVQVVVDGGETIIPVSQNKQIIEELNSNESKDLIFKFEAKQDVEIRNYPILIEVTEDENKDESIKQYVGVFVSSDEVNEKGTPKIIVNKYQTSPSIVNAGENFRLDLSLLNTNSVKEVRNIKVYLTVEQEKEASGDSASGVGNVFTPVDSSNTFFIDSIKPKQSTEKSLTLYTIPSAVAKTYTITVNLEYEDNYGKEYTAKELIGVPVAQPAKLQIGEIKMPEVAFLGQSVQLPEPIQFYNIGKVTMSNFMVKAIGDFDIQDGTYFIGNFDSGSNDYFDPIIIPNKEGKCTGTIVFSYDEPNGKHNEVKKEFTINVQKMAAPEPSDNIENIPQKQAEVQGAKSKFAKIFGIVVVVAAIVVVIIIKKRRAKQKEKEMFLDE